MLESIIGAVVGGTCVLCIAKLRNVPAIYRWLKGAVCALYCRCRVRFWTWRTTPVVRRLLDERRGLSFLADYYDDLLKTRGKAINRDWVDAMAPDEPARVRDVFVAQALHDLCQRGQVVKARMFVDYVVSPQPWGYSFQQRWAGIEVADQAQAMENDSVCYLSQAVYGYCPAEERFNGPYSWDQKRDALPCSTCWQKDVPGAQWWSPRWY